MRLRGDSRHLCRTLSEKISPGRPVGRPSTVVCRRLAGSGLLTCTCSRRAGAGFRGGGTETAERPREPVVASTRATVCCQLDARQKLQLDSRIYLLMRKTS